MGQIVAAIYIDEYGICGEEREMKYSHVFWDWNGTLLDDAAWCLQVLNAMLAKRELPPVPDIESYREVFGFPTVDYYKRVGFDFEVESFESMAEEYIAHYHAENTGNCPLASGAEFTLRHIKSNGIKQLILTASKKENLEEQLKLFPIADCFDQLLAIDDIYARSKVQVGLDYVKSHPVQKGVLIGDTLHDYEVAKELGLDCLLVARGHHGRERLESCGVPVLEGLEEVLAMLI